MAKLFKNSKQVLSFVIAFAIIAVSLFAGVGINADAATKNVIYYDNGTSNGIADDTSATDPTKGTEANPIIIASSQELAYLAKLAGDSSKGKYYKLSDDIDVIVLQNQSHGEEIMAITSADEAKEKIDGYSNKRYWYGQNTFQGHFDGNGVEIYGLYGASGALFPRVNSGTSFKNFALKNSYITSGDKSGALIASVQGGGNGNIVVENVEISNCYVESKAYNPSGTDKYRVGVMVGSYYNGNQKTGLIINNCLVYGNKAVHVWQGTENYGEITVAGLIGSMDGGYNQDGEKANNVDTQFENSIILDCVPYHTKPEASYNAVRYENFDNIYTNCVDPLPSVVGVWGIKWSNYEGKINEISTDNIKGTAAKTAMPNLDWENIWFVTEGYPELRALHNLTAVTPDAEGHGYECADCDIDAIVAHSWDGNTCTECGYTCFHTSQTVTKTDAATCVSKEVVYSTCNDCGKEIVEPVGAEPTGHVVTYVEADPADCTNTGIYGYWHCSVCEGNFLAETEEEAKWAPMDSSYANPETDLIMPADPVGGHSQKTDADGVIVIVDGANGHYYECSVCDGRLNHKSEEITEEEVVKHDFSSSVCKECGWKCEEHDYELTGNVLVVGDCYTDHEDEMKCTICGKQSSKVTKATHNIVAVAEVKATDNLEGTKAHYQCTECKSIYADAEGKTSITKASLVIPKQLPAGYENTYEGTGTTAPENADTSTTSPATADSVMTTVAAAVVLMGAALVIVRKAVKA